MAEQRASVVHTTQPAVFWGSVSIVVLFLGLGTTFKTRTAEIAGAVLSFGTHGAGPILSVSVFAILIGCVYLALSPLGKVVLGKVGDKPEFSTGSWFAMLFSAGMGIGMLFYGVAEPLTHYAHPPGAEPLSEAAARNALGITLFHWGLHAWGIYALVAVALGYRCFALGEPLSIRRTLEPLLGKLVDGPLGHFVDVLAVFATIFGLATSLGLGAKQINGGLHEVFGVTISSNAQVLIIAAVTLAATVSVVSGLQAGVRRLSELNMLMAVVLLLLLLVLGPTLEAITGIFSSLGAYGRTLLQRSVTLESTDWEASWTLFYWAWWVAWSPFVGTFIARISRGRTVREVVVGVLLAPTLVAAVWFSVLGVSAIEVERGVGGLVAVADEDASLAIYALLEQFPLHTLTQPLTVFLVVTFFVTSSDSGSLVVDMLTSGGNVDPPVWQRIFWALTEGAVAATLLSVGGLKALQSAAICVGVPFVFVLLLMLAAVIRLLRRATREKQRAPSHNDA